MLSFAFGQTKFHHVDKLSKNMTRGIRQTDIEKWNMIRMGAAWLYNRANGKSAGVEV